ncbi:hypothetical protein Tco_1434863, partial [Tanacetum coccineum]
MVCLLRLGLLPFIAVQMTWAVFAVRVGSFPRGEVIGVMGRWEVVRGELGDTHKPRRAKIGQDSEIPQSSGTPKKVGDEAVYTGEDDRVVRAATTASSLEAEQESGNIHKTRPIGGAGSEPIHQDTTLGGAYAQTWFET